MQVKLLELEMPNGRSTLTGIFLHFTEPSHYQMGFIYWKFNARTFFPSLLTFLIIYYKTNSQPLRRGTAINKNITNGVRIILSTKFSNFFSKLVRFNRCHCPKFIWKDIILPRVTKQKSAVRIFLQHEEWNWTYQRNSQYFDHLYVWMFLTQVL